MNTRLTAIRADQKLTTRAFGEKIGLSGGAITNMEKGTRNITSRTIADICRVFNVNEEWFRTGVGNMYVDDDDTLISRLAAKYNLNETSAQIIKTFCELPQSSRDLLESFLEQLVAQERKKPIESNVVELHRELQAEDAEKT